MVGTFAIKWSMISSYIHGHREELLRSLSWGNQQNGHEFLKSPNQGGHGKGMDVGIFRRRDMGDMWV
jgi:hypothetical protein